jgi:hypothetical protein
MQKRAKIRAKPRWYYDLIKRQRLLKKSNPLFHISDAPVGSKKYFNALDERIKKASRYLTLNPPALKRINNLQVSLRATYDVLGTYKYEAAKNVAMGGRFAAHWRRKAQKHKKEQDEIQQRIDALEKLKQKVK